MADKIETPEEKTLREAAELKLNNTSPAGNAQPVEKQEPVSKKEKDTKFEGQTSATDHFTVVSGDTLGRSVVSVRPAGWVGDDILTFPGWKVKDLIKALSGLKNLPSEPKAPETSSTDTGE